MKPRELADLTTAGVRLSLPQVEELLGGDLPFDHPPPQPPARPLRLRRLPHPYLMLGPATVPQIATIPQYQDPLV